MNFKLNINVLLAIAILGLNACANSGEKNADTALIEEASAMVALDSSQTAYAKLSLVKFEQISITQIIKVNGKIDVPPQNMYSLSLPLGGYLKYTKLLPGMHFNKGEVIALIEDPKFIDLQQNYLSTLSKVALLKEEYERQLELNASKAVSDKVLHQTNAAYTSERVMLKSLSEQLRLIGIDATKLNETNISGTIPLRAPIDGFVGRVNVNTGKYVSPTEVLFELVNPEDIHLSLNVFEKDINALALGQKVTAYTNSNLDKRYTCEIILIGKEVLEDHSINVHCHFDSYDNKLVPGTFMNAEISQQKKEVWAIPLACVQQFEGKHYIFLKEGEAFSMQEVKLGISNENKVEILEVPTSWRDKEIAENGSYSLLMKLKNAAEEE